MATQLLDGKATERPRPAPVRKPRRVWSSNPAVVLLGTVVGKKVVMAHRVMEANQAGGKMVVVHD